MTNNTNIAWTIGPGDSDSGRRYLTFGPSEGSKPIQPWPLGLTLVLRDLYNGDIFEFFLVVRSCPGQSTRLCIKISVICFLIDGTGQWISARIDFSYH